MIVVKAKIASDKTMIGPPRPGGDNHFFMKFNYIKY